MTTNETSSAVATDHKTIYEFSAKDIDGNDISLDKYKGFAVIVVNIASKCGLTQTNYKELNDLYALYEERGLKIIAFPCNQFLHMEPACDADVKRFALKMNAKYDLFGKVDVNGADAHPLWRWLRERQGGFMGNYIKWNFTKFLVNRTGVPVARFAPTTSPIQMESQLLAVLNGEQ